MSTTSEQAVSEFIQSLYDIVCNPKVASVEWSENGDEVIIHSELQFTNEVLHRYYRASSFASFVRQLNLYGFSKRGTRFTHQHFHRDRPQELHLVHRKGSTAATNPHPRKKLGKKKITEAEKKIGVRSSTRIQGQTHEPNYQEATSDSSGHFEDAEIDEHDYGGYYLTQNDLVDNNNHNRALFNNSLFNNDNLNMTLSPTSPSKVNYQPQKAQSVGGHDDYQTGGFNGEDDDDDDNDDNQLYPFEFDQMNLDTNTNTQAYTNTNNNNINLYNPTTTSTTKNTKNHLIVPISDNSTMDPNPSLPLIPLQLPFIPQANHPVTLHPRQTTQTIQPALGGPQSIPLEQYNATVSALEDQVEMLTQQYHLLYQSQFHVLHLLSRYFSRDSSQFPPTTGLNGNDLLTIDPQLIQKALVDGPTNHNGNHTNLTNSISNHQNHSASNGSFGFNNNNNFNNNNTTIFKQSNLGTHISVETPTPTPNPTPTIPQHGGGSYSNNNNATGQSGGLGGSFDGQQTPNLLDDIIDPVPIPDIALQSPQRPSSGGMGDWVFQNNANNSPAGQHLQSLTPQYRPMGSDNASRMMGTPSPHPQQLTPPMDPMSQPSRMGQ